MFDALPSVSGILLHLGFTFEDVILLGSTLAIYLPFVIAPAFAFFSVRAGVWSVVFFLGSIVGYRFGYYPYEFVEGLGLQRLLVDPGGFSQALLRKINI